MGDSKNDFDVARDVSELLAGLDRERQHRVLRWVTESLGISLHVKGAAAPEPPSPPIGDTSVRPNPDFGAQPPAKSTDIKTFIDSKAPRSDVHFAATVAYYYRFEAPEDDRADAITSEILQDATRLTGRKRLARARMTLYNAKNLGYLDNAGHGKFKLNTVGENLVAMTLPDSSTAPSQPKKVARKKPAKRQQGKKPSSR